MSFFSEMDRVLRLRGGNWGIGGRSPFPPRARRSGLRARRAYAYARRRGRLDARKARRGHYVPRGRSARRYYGLWP